MNQRIAFSIWVVMALPVHAALLAPEITAQAGPSSFVLDQYPAKASFQAPGSGNFTQTASTEVNGGYFRAYAGVFGDGGMGSGGGIYTVTQVLDTITANGYTMILPLHITGTVTDSYSVSSNYPPLSFASGLYPPYVRLTITCTAADDDSMLFLGHDCSGGSPTDTSGDRLTSSAIIDETINLTVSMTPGVPFNFDWGTRLEASAYLPYVGSVTGPVSWQATAIGGFNDTGLFGPAIVLDSNGNVIQNPVITSASGFDYLNPSGPTQTTAPEPGTFVAGLVAMALGCAGRLRRRPGPRLTRQK